MLKANNLFSQKKAIKDRIDAEKKKLVDIDNQIKDLYLPLGKEQLSAEQKDFGNGIRKNLWRLVISYHQK